MTAECALFRARLKVALGIEWTGEKSNKLVKYI